MNISYELYKTFDVVANCSTITEASKKLNITRNELINLAISLYLRKDKHFSPKNNARFSNPYN